MRFVSEDLHYFQNARFIDRKFRDLRSERAMLNDPLYAAEVDNYWANFLPVSSRSHAFYASVNGVKDVRYIPDLVFFSVVEPSLNRLDFAAAIDDKSYYHERFVGVHQPAVVVRSISGTMFDSEMTRLTLQDALGLTWGHEELVIKPSIGQMGGNLVRFFEPGKVSSDEAFEEMLTRYRGNFVIQEPVKQHPAMQAFNPSSVNTIRIMTLLTDGEATHVSSVLRVGGRGARVDNAASGGFYCGITESGRTKERAYDRAYRQPKLGSQQARMGNVDLPSFGDALDLVARLHKRFAHFRLISWDIAIDIDGRPSLIEFNLARQDIDFHQVTNGPLFGDRTDALLEEVFAKGSRKKITKLVGLIGRLP